MKRTPVKKATKKKSGRRKTTGKKANTKIKKDPLKEYDAVIAKGGIAKIVELGTADSASNVPLFISTQSLELDRLLNGLGIPSGRVTEIFGPAFIGKSTLLDHILAEVQRIGGVAILADVEASRDAKYVRSIGVDLSKLKYLDFERGKLTMENVLDKVTQTVDFWASKYPDMPVVIAYDSLGGTATQDELDKNLGAEGDDKKKNTKPGGAAKVLRQACRQLISRLANTKIAVVFANHEYENIQMGGRVGKKRETYGGSAIRLAATCRIELFNMGWVKRTDGAIVGRQVGAKLVKWRLGMPWRQTVFALMAGIGIDNTWAVYERLKKEGIIQVSGSWAAINLDGEVLKFQGWNGLTVKCEADATLFPRLVKVYKQLE